MNKQEAKAMAIREWMAGDLDERFGELAGTTDLVAVAAAAIRTLDTQDRELYLSRVRYSLDVLRDVVDQAICERAGVLS